MQNLRLLSAAAALAVFAAGTACAQSPQNTDQAPVRLVKVAVVSEVASDRVLRNEMVRQCRKVAFALGPLASYQTGGYALSEADLRACNRSVVLSQAPRN